ncbi:hypothetical protein DES40_1924 [Litorimonas taeanensis]|uniref:Uncharacterized protein n=1 Tax=Litorimonas taeanensis TaxID=568099 RepID=A0A420WDT3_9PROT|nr:hypothetical protein [Litorimonas taeanensis]RKQ69138.1 hypothetical protein DES40_1924 [Litorimonas taeanensis]
MKVTAAIIVLFSMLLSYIYIDIRSYNAEITCNYFRKYFYTQVSKPPHWKYLKKETFFRKYSPSFEKLSPYSPNGANDFTCAFSRAESDEKLFLWIRKQNHLINELNQSSFQFQDKILLVVVYSDGKNLDVIYKLNQLNE